MNAKAIAAHLGSSALWLGSATLALVMTASGQSISTEERAIVLKRIVDEKVCPRDLMLYKEVSYHPSCDTLTDGSGALLRCQDRVDALNAAIERYNQFVLKCREGRDRQAPSISNTENSNRPATPKPQSSERQTLVPSTRDSSGTLLQDSGNNGERAARSSGESTTYRLPTFSSQEHGGIVECTKVANYRGRNVVCLATEFFIGGCVLDNVNGTSVAICPGGKGYAVKQYYDIKSAQGIGTW